MNSLVRYNKLSRSEQVETLLAAGVERPLIIKVLGITDVNLRKIIERIKKRKMMESAQKS